MGIGSARTRECILTLRLRNARTQPCASSAGTLQTADKKASSWDNVRIMYAPNYKKKRIQKREEGGRAPEGDGRR